MSPQDRAEPTPPRPRVLKAVLVQNERGEWIVAADFYDYGYFNKVQAALAEVAAPARAHQEEKEENDKSVSRVDGVPGVGQGDLPRKSRTGHP